MLDEVDRWYEATKILTNHKPISQEESRQILRVADDTLREALDQKLTWSSGQFLITKSDFQKRNQETMDSNNSSTMNDPADLNEIYAS